MNEEFLKKLKEEDYEKSNKTELLKKIKVFKKNLIEDKKDRGFSI